MRTLAVVAILCASGCSSSPREATDAAPASSDAAGSDAAAGAPDPVEALKQLPPLCNATGWCWLAPSPMGNGWSSTYATGPDNLWLAGELGYLLQWDGTAWHQHVLPPLPPDFASINNSIFSISGTSPTDMWFIASGTLVYHFDGTAFTVRTSIPLTSESFFTSAVWEAPDTDDVYIGTVEGTLFHANGDGPFEETGTPLGTPIGSLWGVAHDDFWLTSAQGAVFHFAGGEYTPATSPTGQGFTIKGVAADDIWGGGVAGTLVHYDGSVWSLLDTGSTIASIQVAGGLTANDVTIVGRETAPHGFTMHWDGTALTRTTQPFIDSPIYGSVTAVAGRVWAPARDGALYVKEPTVSLLLPARLPTEQTFNALWPDPDGTFWLACVGSVIHLDRELYSQPIGTAYNINAISGARDGALLEVMAVGQLGRVYDYDGTTWTNTALPVTSMLDGVWLAAPGKGLVVGAGGVAFRWNGSTFTPIATGVTSELFGVWGPDPDHAFAVGAGGVILAWSSATPDVMTPIASPTTTELRVIHGVAGKVWLAGDRLWEGSFTTGFTDVSPFDSGLYRSLYAASPTDIYAGSMTKLYHATGAAFVEEPLGVATAGSIAAAVSPTASGGRVAVTASGGVLVHP